MVTTETRIQTLVGLAKQAGRDCGSILQRDAEDHVKIALLAGLLDMDARTALNLDEALFNEAKE